MEDRAASEEVRLNREALQKLYDSIKAMKETYEKVEKSSSKRSVEHRSEMSALMAQADQVIFEVEEIKDSHNDKQKAEFIRDKYISLLNSVAKQFYEQQNTFIGSGLFEKKPDEFGSSLNKRSAKRHHHAARLKGLVLQKALRNMPENIKNEVPFSQLLSEYMRHIKNNVNAINYRNDYPSALDPSSKKEPKSERKLGR